MNMKEYSAIIIFFSLIWASCSKTYKLTAEDYSWMPYNGNEILVFESNRKKADTIFLLRKDTLFAYPSPTLRTTKQEMVSIFCKHKDPNYNRYLESYVLEIRKINKRSSEFNVLLKAEDAAFYRITPIIIQGLNHYTPSILKTKFKEYIDVYELYPENYLGNLNQRSNYVTKLYWSKSEGLIRYDKKDGVYWELVKKY